MTKSTDLAATVAAKGQALTKGDSIFTLLEKQKTQIERALPKHMSADRLLRVVLTEVRKNPRLGECSPQSLLGALMLSAQLGLEPGPLGQVYYVPFRNKNTGTSEVTFIIGYRGLIALALRSDKILSIEGHEVCENDEFAFNYGDGYIKHSYHLQKSRGKVVGYWAKASLTNGGSVMRVLTLEEVESRRARSKSKDDGPWVTDPIAMGIKTAIRMLCSQLPLTTEVERAIAADETAAIAESTGETIDLTGDMLIPEEGEIIDVSEAEMKQVLDKGYKTPMMGDTNG